MSSTQPRGCDRATVVAVRRVAFAIVLVACSGASAGGAALAASGPTPALFSKKPALQVLLRAPLTVSGWRFKAGEHVLVTLSRPNGVRTERVIAGAQGRFLVTFRGVRMSVCDAVSLKAAGSRGSKVSLRAALPACKPA